MGTGGGEYSEADAVTVHGYRRARGSEPRTQSTNEKVTHLGVITTGFFPWYLYQEDYRVAYVEVFLKWTTV
jgi:hypothetical protein